MNTAQRVIENYMNGNLTDAKRIAKRVSALALMDALIDMKPYQCKESRRRIVDYLKGKAAQ